MGSLSAGTEPQNCCLELPHRPPALTCGRSAFCSWGLASPSSGGQPWDRGSRIGALLVSLTFEPMGQHENIVGVLTGLWHLGSHKAASTADLVGEPVATSYFMGMLIWC